MEVIIVTDVDSPHSRVFTRKALINYVNELIKRNDNEEKFSFAEKDVIEATEFLETMYGYWTEYAEVEE